MTKVASYKNTRIRSFIILMASVAKAIAQLPVMLAQIDLGM